MFLLALMYSVQVVSVTSLSLMSKCIHSSLLNLHFLLPSFPSVSCTVQSQVWLAAISAGCDLGEKYVFIKYPGGKVSARPWPNSFKHQCQRLNCCLDYTNLPSHPKGRHVITLFTLECFPLSAGLVFLLHGTTVIEKYNKCNGLRKHEELLQYIRICRHSNRSRKTSSNVSTVARWSCWLLV